MAKKEPTKKELFFKELKKNPDIKKAAIAVGLNESSAYRYARQAGINNRPAKTKAGKIRKVSINQLIDEERLDVKKIIHDGIALLGSRAVAYDDSFRRDLQITQDRWREYSRDPEFEDFRAILPNKKTVWGRAETITELKEMDGVI